MATQPGVWGIDLGQCALKALRVELRDGQVTATAFDYVEHPKILSQPDADPDQLTREALDKFLSRNSLRGDTVAISVPGQSGLARFVKLPPVEEKKIGDIVKFEAKQQIPFNLDEVVWDYQKIGVGMVTDGFALDTEIGLFAIKRDMVFRALQHFQDVNVEVHIVQMAPLALCNFVAYDLLNKGWVEVGSGEEGESGGKKTSIVALDIGADSSNLVITDGERIIWQRPIPLGGNHFTRALTKDLKLTFAKAEHLKRNATKSGPELKKILASLKPVLNDFVGEVQRSLGYFTNTHRDAQVEYMMGLGSAFRLPGLQRYLGEKLSLDVRKLGNLERLVGDDVLTQPAFKENVLSFAVAYGLALQGLRQSRLQTNLLPPEIQFERLVRAKKPWAVASAAALLVGVFGLSLSAGYERATIVSPEIDNAIAASKKITQDKAKWDTDFDAKQKEIEDEQKAVRSVIAGQEERLNWVNLYQFVNDSLPRPDGSNLSPQAAQLYLTAKAQDAYRRLLQRQTNAPRPVAQPATAPAAAPMPGVPATTTAAEDDSLADLIQFNIEAVDCRYTDDLSLFWTTIKNHPTFKDGIKPTIRPAAFADIPPAEKEKGWIVELRGYTYNRGKANFVVMGLVENIARHGVKTAPVAPPPGGTTGETPAAGTTPAPSGEPGGEAAAKKTEGPVVVDRVSHVMLFRSDSTGQPIIGGPVVPAILAAQMAGPGLALGGEGAMPGGRPGGMPMMPGGAGGGEWPSLLGGAGAGGFAGGGEGFARPGAPAMPFGPPGMAVPGGGADPAAAQRKLVRTEFIVLFIWKEPTPSDDLLKPVEVTDPAAVPGADPMAGS